MRTTRLELIRTLNDTGQPDAALHVIREMRQAGVSGLELDVLQAEAFRAIGLVEDAEEMLLSALRQQRRSPEVHNQLGILYMDQQRLDEAVARFSDAHRYDAENPEYANNLGFALMSAGQPTEAINDLERGLALAPDYNYGALLELGRIHSLNEDPTEAIGAYERFLAAEFLRALRKDTDDGLIWRVTCLDQENGLQWLVRMYGSLVAQITSDVLRRGKVEYVAD